MYLYWFENIRPNHKVKCYNGYEIFENRKYLEIWFVGISNLSIELHGPPLWSSGQSSWLQIQRSGFYSQHYQIFWEVVGLEQGPFSLVSSNEELLGRSSGSGLENREDGSRDPLYWPQHILYQQKLTLTSPTSGGRSVGIVRSWTKATEFVWIWIDNFSRHEVNH
jgi:hypothetical protein